MKKVFLSMMVLTLALQGWAQEDHKLTVIPKVGINWSTTSLDTWISQESIGKPDVQALIGPAAGIEVEYQFSELISASVGALYSMQGRKYDDTPARKQAWEQGYLELKNIKDATVNTERHHFINFPVTANFHVAPGLAVRTGLQIGLMFYKTGTWDWPYDSDPNTGGKHDIGSSPKKFDLSIPIGVSYTLKNNLQFDLRYNHGLTNISSYNNSIKEKSRVIQLTVGYRLDPMQLFAKKKK